MVIQRLAHLQQLLLRAPPRGQRRSLGLQAQAQFDDTAHAGCGITAQVDTLARIALKHEGTNAVTGFDQPGCLQF